MNIRRIGQATLVYLKVWAEETPTEIDNNVVAVLEQNQAAFDLFLTFLERRLAPQRFGVSVDESLKFQSMGLGFNLEAMLALVEKAVLIIRMFR